MSIPPFSGPPGISKSTFSSSMRSQGWSVIANRPARLNAIKTITNFNASTRMEIVSPFNVVAIALSYSNYYITAQGSPAFTTGEAPFPNPFQIKALFEPKAAALSATGSSVNEATTDVKIPFTFFGNDYKILSGGSVARTDPLAIAILANQRNFIVTVCNTIGASIPTAPTLAANASGGALQSGTYAVGYTIHYPDGIRVASVAATQTVVSSGTITVTAPGSSNFPGAIGWRCWISLLGATTPLYPTRQGMYGLDTNIVVDQAYNGTGNGILLGSLERILNGQTATYNGGVISLGGTAPGGFNIGEYSSTLDTGANGIIASASFTSAGIGPTIIYGLDPAMVHDSLGIEGDSIALGVGDYGLSIGTGGGYAQRACINQPSRLYVPSNAPYVGNILVACGGETAQSYAGQSGVRRAKDVNEATHIWSNLGTNDIAAGTSSALLISYIFIISQRHVQAGCYFIQGTILPKTSSTDGWITTTNQTLPWTTSDNASEGNRRQFNNWVRSTLGQQVISGEAMFGVYGAVLAYNTNFYAGGNGSATTFTTALPFVQGTETIQVNGVTKVLTTDYTYYGVATISGVNYATGVIFGTAPGNGLSVTASYTSMAGLPTILGVNTNLSNQVGFWDVASKVEVNTSSVLTLNGGLWIPQTASPLVTGTSSGGNTASTFNDTTKSWTQDQYKGYAVRIVTDSTTPTAANQTAGILSNTPTQLSVVWNVTPSATATYWIYDPYTFDGIHPLYPGHAACMTAFGINSNGTITVTP